MNKGVRKRIKKIIKQLKKQRLNSDYIIKTEDYVSALPGQTQPTNMTAQLNTPQVDQKLVASTPQINQQTGLTHTENALLSNEEKAMRLRQRGMA